MNKILYIINDLDFFISHRLPIAVAAKKAGHKIYIGSSSNSKNIRKIKRLGFKFYPIPISRSKKNLLKVAKYIDFGSQLIVPEALHAHQRWPSRLGYGSLQN